MSDTNGELPAAQRQLLRRMGRSRERIEKLQAKLDAEQLARWEMYREARLMVPPIRFTDIAQAYSVSEAAVMQQLSKFDPAMRRAGGGPSPGRPKGGGKRKAKA